REWTIVRLGGHRNWTRLPIGISGVLDGIAIQLHIGVAITGGGGNVLQNLCYELRIRALSGLGHIIMVTVSKGTRSRSCVVIDVVFEHVVSRDIDTRPGFDSAPILG